ncbi:two-component system sensor histidine kinase SenX3 [Labrenzia sp. MBR-25]
MIIEQITARSPASHEFATSPRAAARNLPARTTGGTAGVATDSNAYGRTLSIVAHDLRGPLANLSLLIEDIAQYAMWEGQPAIAENAAKADRILEHLTASLSALVRRGREGRDPLSCVLRPVDLAQVLSLAATVNQPLARRHAVNLEIEPLSPCLICGDAELLFEAFDNLIGNAVRHSPENGTVLCAVAHDEDGNVTVRISDQGQGFTAADLARAFRPFTQLSAKAARPGPSSGLGLWIARLIAERHGGRISAQNGGAGKDTGAVLTVRLPALPANDAKPASIRRTIPERAGKAQDLAAF